MLTILGNSNRFCDGLTRRNFLTIGSLAMAGLPDLLRAETQAGGSSHKSVIMILLPGGPPHLDLYDLKPDAPAEIRGEFQSISTNVPGIEICELLPRMAMMMDKLVVIRSLVGALDDHNLHQCLTGWESHPPQGDSRRIEGYPPGGWPSIGSVLSKIHGPENPAVPPFVSLAPEKAESTTRASLHQSGYLGMTHQGFDVLRGQKSNFVLQGITLERLAARKAMLNAFDRFRRGVELQGNVEGMDALTQQAFNLLTSGKLAKALDISREDPRVREQYGIRGSTHPKFGGPKLLEHLLLARRLVEAGARCVTLTLSPWPLERESRGGHNWDFHEKNFVKSKMFFPLLDQGISALVEDLDARGLLQDVAVVAWGEFGRTPKINRHAGRDHWPRVSCALLAGGGMRTGQFIGTTNRLGEHAQTRPVHVREVFATLYHHVGIDSRRTALTDLDGRPQFLVDHRDPIQELI